MQEGELKELKRLNKLIKGAVNFRQKQRDHEYINNQAHYEGLQWELAGMDQESPFIVKSDINHLKNAIKIRLGSLYANTYYGKLKPLSPNDVQLIEDLNNLYKNEWYRLNADEIIEETIKAGAIFDNGYVKLGFDPDKIVGSTNTRREGVITLERIETANIYLDPNANNINDCDYIVESMPMTMERIKREKPEWYKKLKENNIKGGISKDEDTGNIFKGRDYESAQEETVPIKIVYEKYTKKIEQPVEAEASETLDGSVVEAAIVTEEIEVTRVKETYMVENLILEKNEDYPFEEFRIIPFQWEAEPQSPYGIPLLRGLTVPQKVANLIESATNNIAIHYTVPTWLVSDESGLDVDEVAKLINALGVVWKVTNVENAIKQLDPPKLDKDIITMGQTFVGYIKEYAGVNEVYVGNIGTAGSTSSGTTEAIGRATIVDNEPLKQITDFVERLTRVLIKFMTRYYKDENFFLREEKDNKYEFSQFILDSRFDDINYDFDVDLGSRSKNDRNRQYNLTKEIYQLQNQYKDPDGVIKVTDVVKAAELDNYNEIKTRLDNSTEQALMEKANLIVEMMQIGQTITPNGTPLIDAQELQDGIMDVLDDNNDLSTVENIFNTYKQYEEQITAIQNNQFTNNVTNQMQGNVIQ